MKKPLEVLRLYPEHDYTLAGAFESRARRDPRRPFLLYAGRTWSWAGFGAAVKKTACLLAARGVKKGDRIGVLARNDVGHALLLFACARDAQSHARDRALGHDRQAGTAAARRLIDARLQRWIDCGPLPHFNDEDSTWRSS